MEWGHLSGNVIHRSNSGCERLGDVMVPSTRTIIPSDVGVSLGPSTRGLRTREASIGPYQCVEMRVAAFNGFYRIEPPHLTLSIARKPPDECLFEVAPERALRDRLLRRKRHELIPFELAEMVAPSTGE